MGSLSTIPPAGTVTVFFPPNITVRINSGARAGPRTRGPMLAWENSTGALPKLLSRRTRTASPAIVTRAIMRTVALVIFVSERPCCEALQAATQFWLAFCAGAGEMASAVSIVANTILDVCMNLSSLAFARRHGHACDFQIDASQEIPAGEIERLPIIAAERDVGGVHAAMDHAAELFAASVHDPQPARTAAIDVSGHIHFHAVGHPGFGSP